MPTVRDLGINIIPAPDRERGGFPMHLSGCAGTTCAACKGQSKKPRTPKKPAKGFDPDTIALLKEQLENRIAQL